MLELEMTDDPKRGGRVPMRDEQMRTSDPNVYVAGDLGAISEASIAMEEGRIAGRAAAASLGHGAPAVTERAIAEARERIAILDVDISGTGFEPVHAMPQRNADATGPLPVIECYQRIPCNPCESCCPTSAIRVGPDPTGLPTVDPGKCTGCLSCVRLCPGMAVFLVERLPEHDEAFISMPWEFLPLPERGQSGHGLDREGQPVCDARVVRVLPTRRPGDTTVMTVAVPLDQVHTVRGFRAGT